MASGPAYPIEGLELARGILGRNVYGPAAISAALGISLADTLSAEEQHQVRQVPFDEPTLRKAAETGAMLILRIPRDGKGPLSIRRLYERFPSAFAEKTMNQGVGYLLRPEWTTAAQPFAADPVSLGWRLVCAEPLPVTLGRSYAEQDALIAEHADRTGLPRARVGRRTAVDAVYDLLLAFHAGGTRLLPNAWDWTRTATPDGGLVTVGNFTDDGLQVLAYSTGVRFQALGVCAEVA